MKGRYWVLVIAALLWIGLNTFFFVESTPDKRFEYLFDSATAFSILFTIALALFGFLAKVEFDRKENTFKYLEKWDNHILKEARDAIKGLYDEYKNSNSSKIEKNKDQILREIEVEDRSFALIFNFFQQIYLSIEKKRVDEEVLKRYYSRIYQVLYKICETWLEKQLETDREFVEDLRKLNERWPGT